MAQAQELTHQCLNNTINIQRGQVHLPEKTHKVDAVYVVPALEIIVRLHRNKAVTPHHPVAIMLVEGQRQIEGDLQDLLG